jgi:hypothetical protein
MWICALTLYHLQRNIFSTILSLTRYNSFTSVSIWENIKINKDAHAECSEMVRKTKIRKKLKISSVTESDAINLGFVVAHSHHFIFICARWVKQHFPSIHICRWHKFTLLMNNDMLIRYLYLLQNKAI